MHTLMILAAGLLLLVVSVLVARLLKGSFAAGAGAAFKVFIPIWLVCALVNMWVGVTQAGYTVVQEAPIMLVVFLIPAGVAWLTRRTLS